MYSGREIDDGGYNRVVGPDFRWQVGEHDVVTGQLLVSSSETPDRPDLADEWDGRDLSGHAAELWWYRQMEHWDFFALGNDVGEDFRADNGFVPQVGFRQGYGELGHTFRPEDKPVSRLRLFTIGRYKTDQQGELLLREVVPGFGLDTLLNSFVRFEFAFDEVLGIERLHQRTQVRPTFIVRPGGLLSEIIVRATLGDEIDFANDRLGSGVTLRTEATIRPTDHLELAINADRQWLDVTDEAGRDGRLFTADVARLRLVYTFNSRVWLRLIGQFVRTERDPDLYLDEVDERSEAFAGSAVFAYKLNWQSVLYAGYGADRRLDDLGNLEPSGREFFLKISYAFQH